MACRYFRFGNHRGRERVRVRLAERVILQNLPMDEHPRNATLPFYNRALLLHGSKRDEVLSLAEIEQYGLDSFGNTDYVSIYGMPPREWYGCGIRLLGRTAVECTRDALGDRIGGDVASVARRMPSDHLVVIDPFAGSCNTLFWILRHLPNSEGIAFESDPQVFDLTHRNLAMLGQRIELLKGDYASLLERCRVPEDRGLRRRCRTAVPTTAERTIAVRGRMLRRITWKCGRRWIQRTRQSSRSIPSWITSSA
jgi:hypothetical protein